MAHRYALLSSLHILDGLVDDLNFRAVAANPRSFTYLTALRHDSTSNAYLPPSREDTSDCTQWNEWPWGLDDGGSVTASYRDRAIELAGGVDELSRRYLSRNVRYLVGTGDTSILNGYCGGRSSGKMSTRKGSQLLWFTFAGANFSGETYSNRSRWVEPRPHMDVH